MNRNQVLDFYTDEVAWLNQDVNLRKEEPHLKRISGYFTSYMERFKGSNVFCLVTLKLLKQQNTNFFKIVRGH